MRKTAETRKSPARPGTGSNYWFVRRSYGWGWTPATREGWIVVAMHIALIIIWADVILKDKVEEVNAVLLFITLVLVQSCILVFIAYKKGEPPAWSWDKKRD